jgi:hypothetical protein
MDAARGLRKMLGGAFGLVAIGTSVVFGFVGVATLAYGGFIGGWGQGHYPKWLALIILPIGGLFLFGAYGSARLGLDAIRLAGENARDE